MNKRQLAREMGVSIQAVDKWLEKGLPYTKGGSPGVPYEFYLSEVESWLEQNISNDYKEHKPSQREIATWGLDMASLLLSFVEKCPRCSKKFMDYAKSGKRAK